VLVDNFIPAFAFACLFKYCFVILFMRIFAIFDIVFLFICGFVNFYNSVCKFGFSRGLILQSLAIFVFECQYLIRHLLKHAFCMTNERFLLKKS
jgi:hypothetical protein